MRSKLMETAAKSVLPSFAVEHLGPLSHGEVKPSGMRSGTTIVVFRGGDRKKGNDFLVCAADRKTSLGYYGIASQRTKKIFQVAENSVFLGSGRVGNIQELRNLLKAQCDEFLEVHGSTMSIPGQANLLAQWCNHFRRFLEGWYFSFGAVLAGINENDGTMQIYSVDDDGCRIEFKDFFATGSGGDGATTALDMAWRKGFDLGEAVDMAVQVIYYASTRDSGSSDPRIANPSIAIIDREKGIVLLPKDAVETVLEEFLERKDEGLDRPPPDIQLDDLEPKPRKRRRRKK